MKRWIGFAAALIAAAGSPVAQGQTVSILRSFTEVGGDGFGAYGGLTLGGSTLYGTTRGGGIGNNGIVYKMNLDGSGFRVLHSFTGGGGDGSNPYCDLMLSGSTLYGTTAFGGSSNRGTIFKINIDGSGFNLLHSFSGGSSDGQYPNSARLVLSGSTLYGTTPGGGSNACGTVYKIGSDGSGFGILHSFNGSGDGKAPYGGLTLNGSTLYGTTHDGGPSNGGTIFKMNTSGGSFSVLRSFTWGDGGSPANGLILDGSTLYGTTCFGGGGSDCGTVFKIGTDGTGFSQLHSFAGGDGKRPYCALALGDSVLYGTTLLGGSSSLGTLFKVGADGSDFTVLHSFAGGGSDGDTPYSTPLLVGSTLYGTTYFGGGSDSGVVFSVTVPEPATFVLLGIGSTSLWAFAWRRRNRTA